MHQIIVGQLQLAQEIIDMDGKLGREDKEMIDTSLRTLQRSARLIENVRNLQRLRADNVKLERIDLGEVLDEAVKGYTGIPGRDISINYNSVHGFFIIANPLIKDIFNNLLDNAVKHCNDPVNINVVVNAVNDNGCRLYEVAVEDNGHGIPDDKKAVIFDRLKRGDTKARGTGLGLYIVKKLAEGFCGSVRVEDRVPGDHTKGTRFILSIPSEGGGRKNR
jgi:signal transduction histidine kinase